MQEGFVPLVDDLGTFDRTRARPHREGDAFVVEPDTRLPVLVADGEQLPPSPEVMAFALNDDQPPDNVSAPSVVIIQGRVESTVFRARPSEGKAAFAVARRSHRLLPPAPLGTSGVTESLR